MRTISIDPGLSTGWAVWEDNKLVECGLGDPRELRAVLLAGIDRVFIEKPQIYRAAKSKGDPNDLITLAIRVGEYKQFFQQRHAMVTLVLPMEWKAQVPKRICANRVLRFLFNSERKIVYDVPAAKSLELALGSDTMWARDKRNDMLDAIGIGLFGLSRARTGMT